MKLLSTLAVLIAGTAFITTTAEAKIPRDYAGHNAPGRGQKMEDDTVCKHIYYDHENIVAMAGVEGPVKQIRASWYGNQFHARTDAKGRPVPGPQGIGQMANQDFFHECDATVVAHKTLPKGTVLRITNISSGLTLLVVVQDRGPYAPNDPRREIDLSRGAAQHLGVIGSNKGVVELKMEILGRPKK